MKDIILFSILGFVLCLSLIMGSIIYGMYFNPPYIVDTKKVLEIMNTLGYTQKKLTFKILSLPNQTKGLLIRDNENNIILNTVLTPSTDTVVWELYISKEYQELQLPEYRPWQSKLIKENVIDQFILDGFIQYSPQPRRVRKDLFPESENPDKQTYKIVTLQNDKK